MIVRRWGVTAFAGTLSLVACRETKSPRTVLDQPEATLERTFQQVSNVVELGDGRVALAELKDRTFLFADFKTGEITPVGEHVDTIAPTDPAPGKHKLPGHVLRMNGDTLGLLDFAAERTTLWNEQGQFLGTLGGRGVGGHNQAVAYDAKGNAYKEDVRSVLGGLEPGQELMFDSLSILRISPNDTIADTVAKLKLPPWGRGQFGEQVKMVSTIFAGRDLFGVLPDGSLWVARASNNAVDWLSPAGVWSRGPSRRFTNIPVGQPEKDAFLEKLRGRWPGWAHPPGSSSPIRSRMRSRPSSPDSPTPSARSGWSGPGPSRTRCRFGMWWDVTGRRFGRCSCPRDATLAGFGASGRIYVILREADGRQQIARFAVK